MVLVSASVSVTVPSPRLTGLGVYTVRIDVFKLVDLDAPSARQSWFISTCSPRAWPPHALTRRGP